MLEGGKLWLPENRPYGDSVKYFEIVKYFEVYYLSASSATVYVKKLNYYLVALIYVCLSEECLMFTPFFAYIYCVKNPIK